jgi:hypothetical protein
MDNLSFTVVEGWEQLPAGFAHKNVVGVSVDSKDRVYLLARSEPRVIVYERDGRFVGSWPEGTITNRSHGIKVGPDDSVYCVDDGDHRVRKFSPSGELLMTLGTTGVASDTGYDPSLASAGVYARTTSITHGGGPFNRPTNVAFGPNGELYVTDGYANCRVHRFSADGKLIQSWGEPGTGPGQFHIPHDAYVTEDGRVLVCDRDNDRIQIFTLDGEFLGQWTNLQRPTGVCVGRDGRVYVSELPWLPGQRSFVHGPVERDMPGRVSILDPSGRLLERWGGVDRSAAGDFAAPHALCLDSHGDLYVAEVTHAFGVQPGLVPEDCHTFQKFTRR